MGLTNFSNGVSSFGVPVLPGAPLSTGSYFFVHSGTGSNGNSGASPSQPFATVDYAIGRCTASKGDVILVMPGHAETVTSTSIALDVKGVRVVGLGTGSIRPTFTFSAAAATITVSADDCGWSGCHFVANFADVAAAFTLGAAKNFALECNTFGDSGANLNYFNIVVTGSTNNDADGLKVCGNFWLNKDANSKAFISVLGNLDGLYVADNHVDSAGTTDIGHFITMSSKVCLGARILRNILILLGATGHTVGIFMTGSSTTSTGVVAYNLVTSLDTTTELFDTATLDFAHFENYYTGTIATSGKLWPAVDAA